MRQIWVTKTGPPRVLQSREGPEPTPRTGEVRIRVEASGVNYTDVLQRAGILPDGPEVPFTLGYEVAGTVDMVAQGVSGIKEGDAVLALTQAGGYADVVCVPHRQVFPRLEWMTPEDAAAVPVDYLTAFLCLVVMGSVRKETTVLIHAAETGVGLASLHICRILGAKTFGTAPAEHHEFLRSQGLEHPIDYLNTDYEEASRDLTNGRGLHVILNPFGGLHWEKNYRLLRPSGRLIHYASNSPVAAGQSGWPGRLLNQLTGPAYTPERLMKENKGVLGVRFDCLWTEADLLRTSMLQIVEWYDEALFRPHIDRTFKLSRVVDAHTYVQNGENLGKVLLIP